MSVRIEIVCDSCQKVSGRNVGVNRKAAHIQRQKAKKKGWRVACRSLKTLSEAGTKDFCPECIFNRSRSK